MKINKIIIIIIISLILLFGIAFYSMMNYSSNSNHSNNTNNKSNNNMSTEDKMLETVKNNFNKLNNVIITGSKKDLTKMLGTEINDIDMILGKESSLMKKPSSNVIKQNNLNSYIKEKNKYLSNLEKQLKKNFSAKILESYVNEKDILLNVEVNSYYFNKYLNDLSDIESLLANNLLTNDKASNEPILYKANVKAMQILNENLDNYYNTEETINISIKYKNGKINESSESLLLYYNSVKGISYENKTVKKTVNDIISEAKQNGLLKDNNSLEL